MVRKSISKSLIEYEDPERIYSFLDRFVYDQSEAKKSLSVVVLDYILGIERRNVLLAGPSGSGKTYLVSLLAEELGVPFVKKSMGNITPEGYAGENLSELIFDYSFYSKKSKKELRRKYSVEVIEKYGLENKGIVFLDEFDKIIHNSTGEENFGVRVQNQLLPIIEGEEVNDVDTSNILFVISGAFEGLEDYSSLGLIQYGFIPELVGRIREVVSLRKLSSEELYKLLVGKENSVLRRKVEYFKKIGITLDFKRDALERIAELAYDLNLGARGLEIIIEDVVKEYSFMRKKYVGKEVVIGIDDVEIIAEEKYSFEKNESLEIGFIKSEPKKNPEKKDKVKRKKKEKA